MTVERIYPQDPDTVFRTVKRVCAQPPLHIEGVDEDIKRVDVSTGISLLSWGESFSVIVYPKKGQSLVHAEGAPKLFLNISANPDKHIEEIFRRLDKSLKTKA